MTRIQSRKIFVDPKYWFLQSLLEIIFNTIKNHYNFPKKIKIKIKNILQATVEILKVDLW